MLGTILTSIGGQLLGGGVDALSYNKKRKDALEDQKTLMKEQNTYNDASMEKSYGLQKDMYNYTYDKQKASTQVENLKQAGLNPALMYGGSGGGGSTAAATGGGSASVSGGSASGVAERQMAQQQATRMMLDTAMLKAQIKNVEADTEQKEASANNLGAETETENKKREYLIEDLKQQGLGRWLENMIKDIGMNQGKETHTSTEIYNPVYEWVARSEPNSYIFEGLTNAILETEARTNNTAAQELLTNNKAKGYFQELANETAKALAAGKQADSAEMIALAIKLSAEFDTGVFTNWKTWTNLAKDGIQAIGEIGGLITKSGTVRKMADKSVKAIPVKGFGK